MPLAGLSFGARALTWPQAKSESEAGSFPFPVPLIRAMEDRRADTVPTASVLAGCLRQFQLKRRVDYYEKPADLMPSVFGTAFHEHMEKYTEVGDPLSGPRWRELHLAAKVDLGLPGYEAVEVHGTCDYLHEGVLVRDWKSKVYVPQAFEPPIAHTRQVNVYNWLGAENGYTPAPTWELVYVSQSWLSRFTGPTARLEKVGTWVRERLHEWALYESQGELVPPLEELFADPDPRTKRLPAPCGYCPVRDACLATWREGEEAPF